MIAAMTVLATIGVGLIGGIASGLAALALWSVALWWNARRGGGQ